MIYVYEGLGGWTIKAENNGIVTLFECAAYIVKDERGINWFDFDRAMRDAEILDKEQKNARRT